VRGLTRRFESTTALDGVDLTVEEGEIHALLGPNGAGKTTLLRTLSGLVAPTEGSVVVPSAEVTAGSRALHGRVGLVPSGDLTLYLRISGLENLVFFARLQGLRKRAAVARAHEVLEAVGLGDTGRHRVGTYSHGSRSDSRSRVLGGERRPALLPSAQGVAPLEALEAVILPALRRPPCLVSFSGGRDSSAVLAVATSLAGRHGLPAPIPATNRFAGAPASEEAEWQERVIAHLRLGEWLRLEFTDELDVVGPYARGALQRHGLLWPCNAHFHLPLLEAAAGGALLTGVGGDQLFAAACPPRAYSLLAGRARPRPRDVLTLGLAVAPRPLRRAVHARRGQVPFGWLRPRARRALIRALADEEAREPLSPTARLRFWHGLRSLRMGTAALATLASDHNVLVAYPLAAPEVAGAVARAAPRGFAARTAGMRAVFDDILPEAVIARATKASFDEAFFHRHSRAFAATWDGAGVPARIVDPAALAREWRSPAPTPQSMTLLQAAWLARERSGRDPAQQDVDGLLERAKVVRAAKPQDR
jgi:ABC-type uncharacterized transport system YnjBCD ATPase subunit